MLGPTARDQAGIKPLSSPQLESVKHGGTIPHSPLLSFLGPLVRNSLCCLGSCNYAEIPQGSISQKHSPWLRGQEPRKHVLLTKPALSEAGQGSVHYGGGSAGLRHPEPPNAGPTPSYCTPLPFRPFLPSTATWSPLFRNKGGSDVRKSSKKKINSVQLILLVREPLALVP